MAIDLLPDKIIKRLYDLEKMVQNNHVHWNGSYYKMQKIGVAKTNGKFSNKAPVHKIPISNL